MAAVRERERNGCFSFSPPGSKRYHGKKRIRNVGLRAKEDRSAIMLEVESAQKNPLWLQRMTRH